MLAEIFILRLETLLRDGISGLAVTPAEDKRFVPVTLPATAERKPQA
jgi:hypothetical protein